MSPTAYDLNVLNDTLEEELKAFIRLRHPGWPSQVLAQHIRGLCSPDWAESYRSIFREDETKRLPELTTRMSRL